MAMANRIFSEYDISNFPALSFTDVENYVKAHTGSQNTAKGYKFFAEPGYLIDLKATYSTTGHATVHGKCHRSMRKREPPHTLSVTACGGSGIVGGTCSCFIGQSGFCQHVVGLLYYVVHCKHLGLNRLPDASAQDSCTSLPQQWHIPRPRHIGNEEVQNVNVKKIKIGADNSSFIKSTLYSPASAYRILTKSDFLDIDPKPLNASILPDTAEVLSSKFVLTKFGPALHGSTLAYQQKLTFGHIIHDLHHTSFPDLPLELEKFNNSVNIVLNENEQLVFEDLKLSRERCIEIEKNTCDQSNSPLWHRLRNPRITASVFGRVACRKKDFGSLLQQIKPKNPVVTKHMRHGIEFEDKAANAYATGFKRGKVNVFPAGFVINPLCPWLGCSPDRKVYDPDSFADGLVPFGLLEIKVLKEGTTNFDSASYLVYDQQQEVYQLRRSHLYFYQVQCQMALCGLSWCDFFCYIDDEKYLCQRIMFDSFFFQEAKDKVDTFYFEHCLKNECDNNRIVVIISS